MGIRVVERWLGDAVRRERIESAAVSLAFGVVSAFFWGALASAAAGAPAPVRAEAPRPR